MKLAVNYLNEVRELFEEGKIDFVDYFKLYSIDGTLRGFDWCAEHRDVMFHGFIGDGSNVGDDKFCCWNDIEKQKEYFNRGNTPYTSMHINATIIDSKDAVFERMKENIKLVKEKFNMDTLLENVPARYNDPSKNFLSSPEFIKKVINETDSYLLFDIGHARVSANVFGISFEEYVERLPMDRLVEIHLSGAVKKSNGEVIAPHKCMNEEDYEFLREAVKIYKTLKTVTLEYGSTIIEDDVNCNYPMVSYDSVNQIAKNEVYEQLLKIKDIIEK